MGHQRFWPYLSVHEFEAFAFVAPSQCTTVFSVAQAKALEAVSEQFGDRVEDINDGPLTHPSRRVASIRPGYEKPAPTLLGSWTGFGKSEHHHRFAEVFTRAVPGPQREACVSISGIEGLTVQQVRDEVNRGGEFVVYGSCVSFLIMSLKRSSAVTFVRTGQSPVVAGLGWTLLSLTLGWWGIPWGFIDTPMVVVQNLGGGKDVTVDVPRALESDG